MADHDTHDDQPNMTRAPVVTRGKDQPGDPDSAENILEEARRRAAYAQTQWSTNLEGMRSELAFLMGDQWPDQVKQERASEQRPMLTLNTLPAFVDQVTGDLRQNRPSIHVSPADNADTKFVTTGEDGREISQAEVFEGLFREIEYESQADTHYDQASQHAAEAGLGWLRVLTEWQDNDSFNQDIRIKSIRNRLAVLIDPDAKEFDYSDANYCFIPDGMLREEFEVAYPDAQIGSFGSDMGWWGSGTHITVAEYFRREPHTRELYLLNTGEIMWKEEFEEVSDEMLANNVEVTRRRKVTQYKVWWCRCTAFEILEGPTPWPGQTIPVIPVFGKHFDTEKGPIYRGLTRYAHDAKVMHNFWMTAATERVALAPKAPFLLTPEQIEGHEAQWSNFNTSNYLYLLYNAEPKVLPPKREAPPTMPAAELQVALLMKDEVKSTIGMYDAALGARSNETSGIAIKERRRGSDTGNFTFSDNLNRAIRRVGLILAEIVPKIYDTNRVIGVRGRDEKVERVEINKVIQPEDGSGKSVLVNDLTKGRFNVRVKSGPSYTTQREEAADMMMGVVKADPSMMPIVGDILFRNMDFPDADEVADRLRMRLPPHMLTEQERKKLPPPPEPTPEQQADMALAEAKIADAEARKVEAQAKMAQAQVDLAEAKAAGAGGDIAETIKNAVAEGVAAGIAMTQQPTGEQA